MGKEVIEHHSRLKLYRESQDITDPPRDNQLPAVVNDDVNGAPSGQSLPYMNESLENPNDSTPDIAPSPNLVLTGDSPIRGGASNITTRRPGRRKRASIRFDDYYMGRNDSD